MKKLRNFFLMAVAAHVVPKEVNVRENFAKKLIFNLNNCLEFTARELDLVVLANILVFTWD